MNVELLNLTKKLQEEYNDFHESLFKVKKNDFFETVEIYGVDASLEVSMLENLKSVAIEIQNSFTHLEEDKRLKYWVEICIILCSDIIDLTSYGNIPKLPKPIKERESTVTIDEPNSNNGDANSILKVKEKTALELLLIDAEDEVFELDERCKQLLALLLGLSF